MKKLLGLVAVALLLSFATVSVAWAGPAPNRDQQNQRGEEQQRKTVKQPPVVKHHKAPGKESVKAPPPAHNRNQFKQNRPDRPPAKAGDQKPPNRGSDEVKKHDRQPHGPDRTAAKGPANNHQIKHNNRHAAKDHDRVGPPANHNRHDAVRHERPQPRPRTVHRDHQPGHTAPRHHNWHNRWPDSGNWHRHFRDWSWFISHHVRGFGACYAADRRDRALYIHFEPQDDDYFYRLESRYGHPTYRHRHHHHGYDGWCHYWFRGDNIIAFFLGDDGYSRAFVWRRDEVESHALALGILTPDLQIVYSSYDADMPPDLAVGYTREVLWATVDDES